MTLKSEIEAKSYCKWIGTDGHSITCNGDGNDCAVVVALSDVLELLDALADKWKHDKLRFLCVKDLIGEPDET